ncbi:MAG TPA: hypothetical protein VF480_11290, partial [Verrucomicrobiae bacterium]
TDTGVTNGGFWYVGSSSVGNGIKVLGAPPATGGANYGNSLLGTTIDLFAPANRTVANVWAGTDFGASPAGFTNNLAVGMLVLDSLGLTNNTRFTFSGTGATNAAGASVTNALYVDYLYFLDQATNRDSLGNPAALNINSNLVIYYAQAVINGVSAARKLDHKNNDHLRWVPTYAGYFSSTNLVYPDGTTNTFNAALAQDSQIDSNGNGIPNSEDPTPFFVSSMLDLAVYPTNHPPNTIVISFNTVPQATNTVFYATNLMQPVIWTVLTNIYIPVISTNPFVSANYPGPATNNPFISPQPYPGPAANVMVFDPAGAAGRFYKVTVYPWLTYPF